MNGHSSRSAIRASLSPEDFVERPDENYLSDMADEDYALAAANFSGGDEYATLAKEFKQFLSEYKGSGITLGELKEMADEGGFSALDGDHVEFLSYVSDNGPGDDAVEGEDFTISGMIAAIPAYIKRCKSEDQRFNGSSMMSANFSGGDEYATLAKEFKQFLAGYEGSGATLGELKDAADEGGFEALDGEHIEFLSYVSDNGPGDDAVEGEDFTIQNMVRSIPAYIKRCKADDARFNGSSMMSANFAGDDEYGTLENEFDDFLSQYEGSGVTLGELKAAADEGGFSSLDGDHIEFLSYISDNGPGDDAVEGEDFTISGMLNSVPAYIKRCQEDDLKFNGSGVSENWTDDFEEEGDEADFDEDFALESCDMNDTVTASRRSKKGKALTASRQRNLRRAIRKFR